MRVLITGATKGIGLATAKLFAEKGFDLALCARTESDLTTLQSELQSEYPESEFLVFAADVGKKEEVEQLSDALGKHWEILDVLINNAGVFIPGKLYEEEDGILEKMIETNLYSAYHLTRAVLPMMWERKTAHIFNICSIASVKAYPNGGSYSISKFALLGFSKCLREELKEKGIRVTAVLPGATWTNSWKGVDLPEDRLMQSNDIARSVLSAYQMSPSACVEEIIIRPQLGDL